MVIALGGTRRVLLDAAQTKRGGLSVFVLGTIPQ
jgi:hypothetical protein